jgi:hypothetical protein
MSTIKTPPERIPRSICHEFVEFIPEILAPDTLYISIEFTTAAHLCFCGCGTKVVTPIRPTGWRFIFDGETVSLRPSIGNWGFSCRSHYWIRNSKIIWARPMTDAAIERGRMRDRYLTDHYFAETSAAQLTDDPSKSEATSRPSPLRRILGKSDD